MWNNKIKNFLFPLCAVRTYLSECIANRQRRGLGLAKRGGDTTVTMIRGEKRYNDLQTTVLSRIMVNVNAFLH